MFLKGHISADREETGEAAIGVCMKTVRQWNLNCLQEDGCVYDDPERNRNREKQSPFLLSMSINVGEFILKCFQIFEFPLSKELGHHYYPLTLLIPESTQSTFPTKPGERLIGLQPHVRV